MDIDLDQQATNCPNSKIFISNGCVTGIEEWYVDNGVIFNGLDFHRLSDGQYFAKDGSLEHGTEEMTGSLDETCSFVGMGTPWGERYKRAFQMEQPSLPKLESIGLLGYELVNLDD